MINSASKFQTSKSSQLDSPFVTIILPLDCSPDPYRLLDELVSEVKSQLSCLSNNSASKAIYKKLNRLMVKLPPQNLYKAVVAFLSEDVEDIIPLNYSVEKKASVGNNFDFEEIQSCGSVAQADYKQESVVMEELGQRCLGLQMFGKRTF